MVGGDTFDLISLKLYDTEDMANVLMQANPEYIPTLIFEGGEVLKFPILDDDEITSTDTIAPYVTGDNDEL